MAETDAIVEVEKGAPAAPPVPPPPPPPPPLLLSTSPSSAAFRKKMSNACELDLQRVARNKETDSNIFALGEAVSQLDIDDVLSGVGSSDFSELLNADDGSVTSTSCRLPLSADKPSPTALDKYTTVQVAQLLSNSCFNCFSVILILLLFACWQNVIILNTECDISLIVI